MSLSVWLFARPLSWAQFISVLQWVSDGKYPLCHWGVLVTPLDILSINSILLQTRANSDDDTVELGNMYELVRDGHNMNSVNVERPFSLKSLNTNWQLFSAKYIETTHMTHEEIELEGNYCSRSGAEH